LPKWSECVTDKSLKTVWWTKRTTCLWKSAILCQTKQRNTRWRL